MISVVGLFWLNQAGLPPVVLSSNILSKGAETGPTATQFGPACAQFYEHTCSKQNYSR